MHIFHTIPPYTDDIKQLDIADVTCDRIKSEVDYFSLAR